jgi:hypothetical protein
MTFEQMWEQADLVDAEIGGVNSIPEEEYYDYIESLLMRIRTDIRENTLPAKE